jgi:CRP-like cAMP-binding protein
MANVFVRKLQSFVNLTPAAVEALEHASACTRTIDGGQVMLSEGDQPRSAHAILEGFACRYKVLPGGARQIIDFLLPGDLVDGHMLFMAQMDHDVGALSPCRVADIPHNTLLTLSEAHPTIGRALWWSALVQGSVAREWILNNGRRPADKRIAHLLCELCFRLTSIGLVEDHRYKLPITQTDLADASGLSVVHTNRVLQKLRRTGLIMLEGSNLTVSDLAKLEHFAGFESGYLHSAEPTQSEPGERAAQAQGSR